MFGGIRPLVGDPVCRRNGLLEVHVPGGLGASLLPVFVALPGYLLVGRALFVVVVIVVLVRDPRSPLPCRTPGEASAAPAACEGTAVDPEGPVLVPPRFLRRYNSFFCLSLSPPRLSCVCRLIN